MADFKVSTLISAKDGVSSVVRGIKGSLRSLNTGAIPALNRGLLSAGSGVKGLAGGAVTLGKAVGGIFLGGGIVGGTLAFGAKKIHGLLDGLIERGDELGALSAQLNVGVEPLQELAYAAEQSDVSIQGLHAGLGKLNQNIGKAKLGGGALASVLKKVSGGKSVLNQLKAAKSTEEAFEIVTETMHRTEDATLRAAIAQAAFGGSGKEMIKFAGGGADAVARLRKEQRSYGVLTEKQVEELGKLDEAQNRLNAVWRGLKIEIGSQLMPVVSAFVPKVMEWTMANKDLIAANVVKGVQSIASGIKSAYEWLSDVNWSGIYEGIKSGWNAVAAGASWAAEKSREAYNNVKDLLRELDPFNEEVAKILNNEGGVSDGIKGANRAMQVDVAGTKSPALVKEYIENRSRPLSDNPFDAFQNATDLTRRFEVVGQLKNVGVDMKQVDRAADRYDALPFWDMKGKRGVLDEIVGKTARDASGVAGDQAPAFPVMSPRAELEHFRRPADGPSAWERMTGGGLPQKVDPLEVNLRFENAPPVAKVDVKGGSGKPKVNVGTRGVGAPAR